MKINLVRKKGSWLILMYNPRGPAPIWNATFMEHQSLLCTNHIVGSFNPDIPIPPGGFPVASLGRPVRTRSATAKGLDFPGTKEEPFMVLCLDL